MFNPPASPTNGAEFTYGNVTWEYQNPPGVWNIKDGTLVGTDGVGVSGFRIDESNLKFYYVYPDGATSAEINLGTVVGGGGVGGGLTFRASNNTTDSVEPGETFTITGAGPTVRTTVSGNRMTVDVRIASDSVTGVASYGSEFTVSGAGVVSLDTAGINAQTLRDSFGNTDATRLSSFLTITGGAGVFTVGGANDTIAIRGHTATSSQLGVASFNSRDFEVSSNGAVSFTGNAASIVYRDSRGETGEFTAAPTRATFTITGGANGIYTYLSGDRASLIIAGPTASYANRGSASFNSTHFEVTDGAVSLSGAYASTVTGDTVVAGSGINISRSGNEVTVNSSGVAASDFRIGSYTLTGVASFDPRFFGIGSTGHLTLSGPYQVTGDTVTGGASTSAVKVYRSGNVATVDVRVASAGTSGVASFNPTDFNISPAGAISFAGTNMLRVKDSQNNSNTVVNYTQTLTITGGPGILTRADSDSDTLSIVGATATYSALGIASFNSTHFAVASGAVSLSGSYGVVGVTGIGFGNDSGLVGKINITAGTNITITESGKTITINSSGGGGGGSGITAPAQQVLYSSGNGGTGSENFLFNGTSLTFGGTNTIMTVTGPTMSFSPRTAVFGGVYGDFKERGYSWTIDVTAQSSGVVYIGPTGGYFQKIDIINVTGGYWNDFPNGTIEFRPTDQGWSSVPNTVESIVVIAKQRSSGRIATFPFYTDLGTFITHNDPPMMGVTGGVDLFMITRYKTDTSEIFFGQSLARGMTGYTFTY